MQQQKQQTNLPIPQGSWIKTARNYYVKGDILHAELKKIDQTYKKVSIQINSGEKYMNYNGLLKLEMSKDDIEQAKKQFPKGAWIHSARNQKMDGDKLSAELQMKNGSWRKDSVAIQFDKYYELSNQDGYFKIVYI